MQQRILIGISGAGLLYLGAKVLATGGHFIKGVHSDYGVISAPVAVFFMVCGVVLMVSSIFKGK